MAARYEIDNALGVVFIIVDEKAEAWEIANVFEEVLRDPRVGPEFHFVSDRRGLQRPPDAQYVRAAVAVIRQYQPRLGRRRVAILIDADDPAMAGMGRLAETFADQHGVELRLFIDYDEAIRWVRSRT